MQPAATQRLTPLADRAFELSSVLPLGGFALLHALDYGRVLLGAREIGARHHPSAGVVAAEVLLVWLPLGWHVVWSLVVWKRRRRESVAGGSALLLAHRLAGVFAGIFLVDHFVRFRLPILRGEVYPSDSVLRLAAELSTTRSGVPLVAAFQLAGTLAVAFHLSVGLRRIAERSERYRGSRALRSSAVGVGIGVGAIGVLTILRLATGA